MLRIINRENILLLPMENQRAFYSSPAQLVQVKRSFQLLIINVSASCILIAPVGFYSLPIARRFLNKVYIHSGLY